MHNKGVNEPCHGAYPQNTLCSLCSRHILSQTRYKCYTILGLVLPSLSLSFPSLVLIPVLYVTYRAVSSTRSPNVCRRRAVLFRLLQCLMFSSWLASGHSGSSGSRYGLGRTIKPFCLCGGCVRTLPSRSFSLQSLMLFI
jgi:hypothetical protein